MPCKKRSRRDLFQEQGTTGKQEHDRDATDGNSMAKKRTQQSTIRASESIADRKRRARRIIAALRKEYPKADCALTHRDPFQLLIATILSAQSTDETVNKVTPVLFSKYKTPAALGRAAAADVEAVIHSTGFFRQKAKSIREASRRIADDFGGKVPASMEDLVSLPGVARKTANVVLGTAFGDSAGVVVDTHVGRLAMRLALTVNGKDSKDAVRIERDLMEVVPQKQWTFLGHALIWHGRRVCSARKPACESCTLAKECPSAESFENTWSPRGKTATLGLGRGRRAKA